MRKIGLTLFAFAMSVASMMAQAPQAMNYQVVIRNADGTLSASQSVSVRASLVQGADNVVYVEEHQTETNVNGLATLAIGAGRVISGDFASIDWSTGDYSIEIAIDPDGGGNYSLTSRQSLLSVPYALYAANATIDYSQISVDVPSRLGELENDMNFITESEAEGFMAEVLYTALKTDSVRRALIEYVVRDTVAIKKYGEDVFSMLLDDKAYVKKLGGKTFNSLVSDTAFVRECMTKVFDKLIADKATFNAFGKMVFNMLDNNKELMMEYAGDLFHNEKFRAFAKSFLNEFMTRFPNALNNVVETIGKDRLVAMLQQTGVLDEIKEQMKDELQSELESEIQSLKQQIIDEIKAELQP